jgi:leucyl-tRNA synthetase
MEWNDNALKGVERFINRFWNYFNEMVADESDDGVEMEVNKVINKVTEDIDDFRYNTAIAAMMEMLNEIEDKKIGVGSAKKVVKLMAPFAPYMTEEIWESLGESESIHVASWPNADKSLLKEAMIEVPIQINGKMRGKVEVSKDISKDEIKEMALEVENVADFIGDKEIKKFIYVPGKIINFVV